MVKQAFAARNFAVKNGRDFCLHAVGVLKVAFGQRWNSLWNTAGFVQPTLKMAADPVPMLVQFREFFNANASREVASLNVTSALAQQRITEIQSANSALAQARTELIQRQGARDFALRTLRERLSGLRSELDQVLSDQDGRWYDFGFRRPADGDIPVKVKGLHLTQAGPGVVLAKWDTAALATGYRVSWRPSGDNTEGTEVGLFSDTECSITGLPSGALIVAVTARNTSGETEATEATITLP